MKFKTIAFVLSLALLSAIAFAADDNEEKGRNRGRWQQKPSRICTS